MSLPILLDMNLSPAWVEWFAAHGRLAVHWSAVGDPRAKDRTVLSWAREAGSNPCLCRRVGAAPRRIPWFLVRVFQPRAN